MKLLMFVVALAVLPNAPLANMVALVIGNSSYTAVAQLDNPQNDSDAVALILKAQGFEVVRGDNLNRNQMYDALRAFRNKADRADIALVYYAGHGIEVAGQNYLVPVDAQLEDERDASVEMIAVNVVLRQISGAGRMKILVLDACRNNPFVTKMKRENRGRNVGVGLGNIQTSDSDTLIAYAAAAGEITPDGDSGGNSPFTRAFLNAMNGPPADVRRLLGKVRDEMRLSVPGAAPFVYSSLGGGEYVINPNSSGPEPEIVVTPPAPPAPPALPAPPTPPMPPAAIATDPAAGGASILADFAKADRRASPEEWDAFLIKYRALNYHLLYALALEKRDAMRLAVAVIPRNADPAAAPLVATPIAPAPVPSQEPDRRIATAMPATLPETARAIQSALAQTGCYKGSNDGILGRKSRAAITRFAQEAGVVIDLRSMSTLAGLHRILGAVQQRPGIRCPVQASVEPRQPSPRTPRTSTVAPRPTPAVQPPVVQPPTVFAAPTTSGRGGQQLPKMPQPASPRGPVTNWGPCDTGRGTDMTNRSCSN